MGAIVVVTVLVLGQFQVDGRHREVASLQL